MDANNSHNDGTTSQPSEDFRKYCRDVVDFPKKGVVFRDITTLLKSGEVFKRAIDVMAGNYVARDIDTIVCIDARGFLIGSALAYTLGSGIVPVRKKGKLPWLVNRRTYDLEYGQDILEIHQDAIESGQRVLLVDDVLATGGTAAAVVEMIKEMSGDLVGAAFFMELIDLKGREKLRGVDVYSLMQC